MHICFAAITARAPITTPETRCTFAVRNIVNSKVVSVALSVEMGFEIRHARQCDTMTETAIVYHETQLAGVERPDKRPPVIVLVTEGQ